MHTCTRITLNVTQQFPFCLCVEAKGMALENNKKYYEKTKKMNLAPRMNELLI